MAEMINVPDEAGQDYYCTPSEEVQSKEPTALVGIRDPNSARYNNNPSALSTVFTAFSKAPTQITEFPVVKKELNTPHHLETIAECSDPYSVNADVMRNMILVNQVPITCCAIGVNGLPYSGKSETLSETFRVCMPDAAYAHMCREKQKDRCLNVYDICAFSAYPFDKFKWSHITKRFSTVFFILSELARMYTLRKLDFSQLVIENLDLTCSISFKDKLLDEHFKLLHQECINVYRQIQQGEIDESLLMEGLYAFTCFDTGVSKAVYDIMPLFAFCFKKMNRFTFCSLNKALNECEDLSQSKYKDTAEQNQIMKHFPRLDYLLRFASGGCDIKHMGDGFKTVVIATTKNELVDQVRLTQFKSQVSEAAKQMNVEDTIETDWVTINTNNRKSIVYLQEQVEKKIGKNKRVHISVPLKWIFLRSLLANLTFDGNEHILLSFQKISNWASKLEMNTTEIERFLTTFTEIGSLLYCPVYDSLSKFVIVDIEAFVLLLDTLYHPHPNHDTNGWISKYGIVTVDAAKSIFGDISINVMDILVSLELAVNLSPDQVIINGEYCSQKSHFMPNIRAGDRDTTVKKGSLMLRFLTPTKSENEATLSKSILSRHPSSKIKLIATENVNCTKLRINLDEQTSFEIHILYHAKEFELRLVNIPRESPPSTNSIISTCTAIIEGFCRGMLHEANFKRGVDFSIEFKCLEKQGVYHQSADIMECESFQSMLNADEKNDIQWWIAALKKCKVSLSQTSRETEHDDELTRENIISCANKVTNQLLSDKQIIALKEKLGFEKTELAEYHGWDLFTMMFIMWGKRTGSKNLKKDLDEIIELITTDSAEL